jgi:hypothetical protein
MTKLGGKVIKLQAIRNYHKILIGVMIPLVITLTSCSTMNYFKYIFTERITVQQAIDKKEKIDASDNPAYKLLLIKDLMQKRIKIENAPVKDIISSSNIDYSFCVIVSVPTDKGPIDCHIYANDLYQQEDIKTISRLKKDRSRVDIDGDFKRFFSLLDETYTKIEIINSRINILD